MTIGQLLDAVLLEAAERKMTLDSVSLDRIRGRIMGTSFAFSERDAHAIFVVTRDEMERGNDATGIARYACGFANMELARRLYDKPETHTPRPMDA